MNINELTKSLSDRAVALEVIAWLRENELLADNSGDVATDTQLAEQLASFGTNVIPCLSLLREAWIVPQEPEQPRHLFIVLLKKVLIPFGQSTR